MVKRKRFVVNQVVSLCVLLLGIVMILISAFYVSSFLAILGVALAFCGILFLYITPTRYVPLNLLNAAAEAIAVNIERILTEYKLDQKGIYLPPKHLQNIDSSLVFVPKEPDNFPQKINETSQGLLPESSNGVFITPPGIALSKLFEQELGKSFTQTDPSQLQAILSKLLIDNMALAGAIEVHARDNVITVELTNSILSTICQETNNQPRTHEQVGCLLSSALGCAIAKSTGQLVTLQKETYDFRTKVTFIEYHSHER